MGRHLLIMMVTIVCVNSIVYGQYVDMGVIAGISKYQGDLTPTSGDLEIHPLYGGYMRYNFSSRIAFRLVMQSGGMSGKDANSDDYAQQLRNLSFKSRFFETCFMPEVNLIKFIPGKNKKQFTPYITGGIAFLYYNPQAEYHNQWYDLQNLGTEGQGTAATHYKSKYSLLQVTFPVGIGFKYALNEKIIVGFDIGYRFTSTDYLDDVGGTYANPDVIRSVYGDVAAALSNRTAELTGFAVGNPIGKPRANTDGKNDSYMCFNLYFAAAFYDVFPFSEKNDRSMRRRVKVKQEPGKWF